MDSRPADAFWTVPALEQAPIEEVLAGFRAVRAEVDGIPMPAIPLRPSEDPREHVGRQLRAIASLAAAKLSSISGLVVRCIEESDWLVYGMAGRSLIEHVATLRYYFQEKLGPLVEQRRRGQRLSDERLAEVRQVLMQCIRSGRFDWAQPLAQWLGAAPIPAAPDAVSLEQVNVLTCVQKWDKESNGLAAMYAMFCDMVHPNLGSSLLVISLDGQELGFDQSSEAAIGRAIVCGTGRALLGVAESLLRAIREILDATA